MRQLERQAVPTYLSPARDLLLAVHAGLLLSKYLPGLVRRLKPVLSAVALLDTCACVGASLSSNAAAARTRTGALVLVPVSAQQKQPALAPDLRIE